MILIIFQIIGISALLIGQLVDTVQNGLNGWWETRVQGDAGGWLGASLRVGRIVMMQQSGFMGGDGTLLTLAP
jgi:hypothetical protein